MQRNNAFPRVFANYESMPITLFSLKVFKGEETLNSSKSNTFSMIQYETGRHTLNQNEFSF